MKKFAMTVIIVIFVLSLAGGADTVYMKSGAVVQGKVLRETANEITLERGTTAVVVNKNLITRIDKSSQAATPRATASVRPLTQSGGQQPAAASAPSGSQPQAGPAPAPPFLPYQSATPTPAGMAASPFIVVPGQPSVAVPAAGIGTSGQGTPQVQAPLSSEVRYAIQTVATNDAKIAKSMAETLAGLGYKNVYIVYESPYFKARIGTYGTRGEADSVMAQLETQLKQTCWLTEESRTAQAVEQAIAQTAKGVLPGQD
jgi:hypothetical protein